jgi:glycosyltransferase involved in cell wall biosynthesis
MNIMLNTGKGGMEEVFLHYNTALSDFCEVISVISSECKHKEKAKETSAVVIELNTKFSFISAMLHLRSIAKKYDINIVFAHGAKAAGLAKFSLLGLPIRRVGIRHTFFSSKLSAFKWRLQNDISIAVNKKLLLDIGKNAHLIYNVTACNVIDTEKKQLNKHIKIGFLGRIVSGKGTQFLVKALGLLAHKNDVSYDVLIAGDGKYMKALKNITFIHGLDDKVKFIGYVNDKKDFFQNIDIFCLPSLREAFGLVLIESMAHGVPVIASNILGINEVISHENNGLLFTPGDHHDLAQKIEMLTNDSEKLQSIVSNGINDVKKMYTIDRLRVDLKTLVENALNNTI